MYEKETFRYEYQSIHCRWIHFIHSIDSLLHWYSISDNHLTIHQFDSFIQYKDIQFHYHSNDLQFIVMHYHQIINHDCHETLKIITHSIHDVLLHDSLNSHSYFTTMNKFSESISYSFFPSRNHIHTIWYLLSLWIWMYLFFRFTLNHSLYMLLLKVL